MYVWCLLLQFLNGEKGKKTAKWFPKASILYLWPNKNLFKAEMKEKSFREEFQIINE